MKRALTREEQDKEKTNTQPPSLRDTNLSLKGDQPYFEKKHLDKIKSPHFEKTFKPRELIRTAWYALKNGTAPEFLFNALLHDIPKDSDVFDSGDITYTVKNVTRNLLEIKPGAMKETSVAVLVSQRKKNA